MKNYLEKLYEHKNLDRTEARQVLIDISEGKANNSQVASFMTVFLMRPIHLSELRGFRDALLELCIEAKLQGNTIDVCGTGGDSKNTFNISTLSSFVVAASGVKVAKHGNYGVSSVSGSSNVLEYFGYAFTGDQEKLQRQLDETNICFMHAPLFHPALKQVAPVRREIGIKTFFNMLGPLVNPSKPKYRMAGVFSLELARLYNYLLQEEENEYCIVHSLDGYDEISTTGSFRLFSKKGEQLVHPSELGIPVCRAPDLFGGDSVKEAAFIFQSILEGKGTEAQHNAVAINSAYAIHCATGKPVEDSFLLSKEILLSQKALYTFKKLISLH